MVAEVFYSTNTNVAQQPSFYTKNWKGVNVFGRCFALLQSQYACGYEINMWKKWRSLFVPMRYCVGHGLFIRFNFLKKVGFFPSPIEVTRLGHICSYLEENIAVIPRFDNCEVAPRLLDRIRQNSVWFSGEVRFFEGLFLAKKIQPIPFILSAWLILYKLWRTTVWMFKGIIILGILILTFYTKNLIAVLGLMIYFYVPLLALLGLNKKITDELGQDNLLNKSIFLGILFPLEMIFMSLGPWYAIVKYTISKISGNEFSYPKTPRRITKGSQC